MNKVFLHGRLGRDPELRQAQSGKPVCNLWVATSEKFGDQERTTWHSVVVWDKSAVACAKCLGKGSQVLVEGRISVREWEKDGAKQKAVEVVAERVDFVGPKREQAAAAPAAAPDSFEIPF